jgi:hypothetical protein
MISYKDSQTKDDKLFIAHAKRVLGSDWGYVISMAADAYNSHTRPSVAKREANLVILNALKEIGEQNWRQPKEEREEPVKRIEIKPQALPPRKEGAKKWTGESILERADRERKERKEKGVMK